MPYTKTTVSRHSILVKDRQGTPSQKALDYFMSLGHERDCGMSVEEFDAMVSFLKETGALTAGFVSDSINEYKDLPKRATAKPKTGYYSHEGKFYVVVENKAKTNVYAKVLTQSGTKWSWVYAPGMGSRLAHMTPVTLEEAAKWGHAHGNCMICLRPLTDPESVKAGIGPVCSRKLKGDSK